MSRKNPPRTATPVPCETHEPLTRIIENQKECADYLLSDGPDKAAARAGLADWVVEECLVRGEYGAFLESKTLRALSTGFEPTLPANPFLMPFQAAITGWGIRRGRAAFFEDCGTGKTLQQLEWARHVGAHTGKPVLIYAPLAVSQQTKREGVKFAIEVNVCRTQEDVLPGINITNYEKIQHFQDASRFGGIVLDESSILKGFDGKTRKALTEWASVIPFRLACTATPAPNDYMELGNHAEFLGVMTCTEMLATFFVHDGGDTSKWRLKKHAVDAFWKWVASWAVALRRPSDLGYSDDGFILPTLHMEQVTVSTAEATEGFLFPVEGRTLQERNTARRDSISERVEACAKLVNDSTEQWLVWCNLNSEGDALERAIPRAVQVAGADTAEFKENAVALFVSGKIRVLVSKSSIFGFGLNLQNCSHVAFVGLSDSYEQFYQAVRRVWRFGQAREVWCYVITAETEGAVVRNIQRKEKQATEMMEGMVRHMKTEMQKNVSGQERESASYERATAHSERWRAILGDCVEEMALIDSDSIDYSIFSPPFASLYVYSRSERDMGNSIDYTQFKQHFSFLVQELYRVLKPGRLVSFHCMNLPISKQMEGFIGIRDFRGDLIKAFLGSEYIELRDALGLLQARLIRELAKQGAERNFKRIIRLDEACDRIGIELREYTSPLGFIMHSEVVIWKDPVTAMQRTKALGLLYKQLRKDSCMSRQGIPDYLVTMRKPGVNPEPVTKTHESFPVDRWRNYASPVWMDINPSDTLQRESAREQDDERHICPLQLQVIERAIELWTNPDDLVLSPFMGIASEGHVALKMGRRFLGIELKRSYWEQACKNLEHAEKNANAQTGLFGEEEIPNAP
jgi:hypothetical protein